MSNSIINDTQPLKDSLGFLVNALARLLRTELENRLHNKGLSPTTWTVLMALGEEEGLRQIDLSRRTFLDGATMTRALDVLEARGFIERNRDELDRRAQLVTLTPRGREVYLPIAEIGEEINAYATSILTSKERTAMENPLRKVIEYLQNLQSANSMGTAE